MNPHPLPCAAQSLPWLERFRLAACARGDRQPTADNFVSWARAFVRFHNKRHPCQMGLPEGTHFLEPVVQTRPDPLPALAQAREALTLLYGGVLGRDLGELPHSRPPRVLDQLRLVLRVRHSARHTEACYVHWARRLILYHRERHPRTMGAAEVEQFRTHRAVRKRVSASTQNQARNALRFWDGQVLAIDLGGLDAVRAWRGDACPSS